MEYRLATFLAVCEDMNFTHAAQALHITQPAVSQQIRWLEQEYGAELFSHEGKKVSLTQAGRLLKDAATTMRNDESVLRRRMAEAKQIKRSLWLGATRTIGEFGLQDALASYLRYNTNLELHLVVGNTENLLQQIQNGTLQCAFVEGYFDPQQFDSELFCLAEYVAVCAAAHSFAHMPATVREMENENLLLREPGSGTREILEKFLSLKNMKATDFRQITEIGSVQLILKLLQQDAGISFLYQMAAQESIRNGLLRTIPLEGMPIQHALTLVWERESSYAEEYRQLCREFSNNRLHESLA